MQSYRYGRVASLSISGRHVTTPKNKTKQKNSSIRDETNIKHENVGEQTLQSEKNSASSDKCGKSEHNYGSVQSRDDQVDSTNVFVVQAIVNSTNM